VALLSSIPVFSIIIRYNLIESGVVTNKKAANFWAVIFPWIIGVFFYTGAGLDSVINWTSLFVNGLVNFIIPLLLYIMAHRKHPLRNNSSQEIPSIQEAVEDTYHAFPPHWKWLHAKALAGILVAITAVMLVVVIVTDFVYLALGQNLVG